MTFKNNSMKIIKKDGNSQNFNPNKVLTRIKRTARNLNLRIDADKLSQKVIPQIQDGMTTNDIDNLIVIESLGSVFLHPDHSMVASAIEIDNLHKLHKYKEFNIELDYSRDYSYDYLAWATFKKSYRNGDELPQEMYGRIATELSESKEDAQYLYDMLSTKQLNFATPINLTAGTGANNNRFISCDINFLKEDSLEGIVDTLGELAKSSKDGSGIGIYIGNLRSSKSKVGDFNGNAAGIPRLADLAQGIARFFNQRGRRNGAFALYAPTWHKDIISHLELRLNEGDERLRTRDIFNGVCVDDLFMEALLEERDYYLFCPNDIVKAGLKPFYECSPDEFRSVYAEAIELGLGEKINPRDIWNKILMSQASTGTPYVVYIDSINRKNMQEHFGNIKSSNLCVETLLYADKDEVGQCALGSIPLMTCKDIREASRVLSYSINLVIDRNVYSTERAEKGGLGQRTIGIGVAGLAEYLYSRGMSFESEEGKEAFKNIMREIYLGAVKGSQEYYEKHKKTFRDYDNSLYAKGVFNPQKWGVHEHEIDMTKPVANSLFTALMPTASSSNLLGCTEMFEVPQGMVYRRKLDKGEFVVVQRNLVEDLEKIGIWNEELAKRVVMAGGTIQGLYDIPKDIREKYKTAYEVSQKKRIDMINHAFPYIDQSTSLNLYYQDGNFSKLSAALIHGWKIGNKTGVYYTRVLKKDAETTSDLFMRKDTTPEKPEDSDFECFGCSA
jgi:ribonucleoside-diphosphate reductase alpha chain